MNNFEKSQYLDKNQTEYHNRNFFLTSNFSLSLSLSFEQRRTDAVRTHVVTVVFASHTESPLMNVIAQLVSAVLIVKRKQ